MCYACGSYNPRDDNAKNTYTLSAKLKYYFNSNTISF
nr:MAG TPA: hypothetical protein [Caudoviricetes sp.]